GYLHGWDRDSLALPGNDYAGDDLVELRLGEAAVAIDRTARTVHTSAGRRIGYDAVVLATGSRPFVPPVPGNDLDRCFVYRTLEDLDAIRAVAAAAGPGAAGIVVGGGLLGLEAANTIRLLGLSPHVLERSPRLMPLQVDDGGGALLNRIVADLGITVHTEVAVTGIAEGRDAITVSLSTGRTISAALLVFAAGVRPRDELARDCGLAIA